ncbi:hypothetical protein [Sinorhizobium meliloti]|uniref:hypothetical protein n=1 Tax=Rhizobium meliloti TaxID=382 RepID=UPI00191340ED|nr:hypothetical protein [Sinorhizobium meliloti]
MADGDGRRILEEGLAGLRAAPSTSHPGCTNDLAASVIVVATGIAFLLVLDTVTEAEIATVAFLNSGSPNDASIQAQRPVLS